jgi:hypothetical protein
MRTRLLLALLSIPVVCAVVPRPAAAQRYRDHGRVSVYRDGRGYRDRVYTSRYRYKEPTVYRRTFRYRDDDYRYRDDDYRYRDDDYRYRDELYYRNQYRYRDRDRYRYEYRRRTNIADLILIAAREAAYRDRYSDRRRHSRRHPRGVGIYIDL